MPVEIRLLNLDDLQLLDRVAPGVFDGPVDDRWSREFFRRRHHIVVAIEDGLVVGMATAIDYVHPDKAPQLFIIEMGVAPSHQRKGIGRLLLDGMLDHGAKLGCTEAWLGTENDNVPARALYVAGGGKPEPFVMYSFPLDPGRDG